MFHAQNHTPASNAKRNKSVCFGDFYNEYIGEENLQGMRVVKLSLQICHWRDP